MKIGVLGSGVVAKTLGSGFIKHGYEVMLGTGDKEKLSGWKSENGEKASVSSFENAAKFGDIIVLAVKGSAAESALTIAGEDNIAGKTVIDVSNPIADSAPVNGVLQFFTDHNKSLMEILQNKFERANFVKAFSCVGAPLMVDPDFGEPKPTMFISGNNEKAKGEVKIILDVFGWEVEDLGFAEAARAIEPLCILWCIPGFRENRWAHAFKLLKK
ncbi:MAG: dinucleotide-binding protein [Ignavibacteria bacterium]|nr:MAG: dinucleotide-binding protein [Ignavibacteria bacterium]